MTQIIAEKTFFRTIRLYVSLTKPGIVLGNMISAFAGYLLAAKGSYALAPFFFLTIGLSMVIGAGCILNNCFDAELDATMPRTKNRALPRRLVDKKQAFLFGIFLAFLGGFFLSCVNTAAVALAFLGLFLYVGLYTFLKYVSVYATLVGAIPGAIPPLVGYVAAKPVLDAPFFLLFALLVFWQMPHFYAICLFRLNEFKKASLPVFPIKKGIFKTKIHMLVFACAFSCTIFLLAPFLLKPRLFSLCMGSVSLFWIWQCIAGFWRKDLAVWAKSVFVFSILLMLFFSFSCIAFA